MSSLSARPLARSPGDAPWASPWDARTLCWCETLWTQPNMGTKRDKKGGMSHKKDKLVVEKRARVRQLHAISMSSDARRRFGA